MKNFFDPITKRLDYGQLTALAIPLLALIPLLTHAGLPNTADGPVHLMRQVQLNQAWAEGNFYPRWGTDLALGHGMPIFGYAPPFLYHMTQLFHLTGLPLDESMKGVLVFDFLLYSLGMFLFIRPIFGSYPALLAAAVYVYAPYRLREAYIQGNYGQFSGLAFYPLIFWAFYGLITDGRPRYLVASALALAGLLFSHNISFMLFAPMFGFYLVFLIFLHSASPNSHRAIPALLRVISGGLLGLGLAAIFWLPAFGERHDIKLEGITQGFFDFRENFISLPELLSPPIPLDLAAINPEFPLSLGLPQIIGAAAGILALLITGYRFFTTKTQTGPDSPGNTLPSSIPIPAFSHSLFFTLFLLIYTFLALPYSQIAWENVPLIELAEFPWRMLGPAIFCASILSATGLSIIQQKYRRPLTACLLIIVIGLNVYYLYPSQFILWGTPTPTDGFAYEAASGAIGTTSTGEFLPRWAQQHPQAETLWPDYAAGRPPQKLDPATVPDRATIDYVSHQSEADTLRIDTPIPFEATLRTLYWPGWQIYLDNRPIPFTITDRTGLMQALIPAGRHTLTLRLENTPLRAAGQWITLMVVIILGVVSIWAILRPRSKNPGSVTNNESHPLITPAFFTFTTAILISLYLLSRPLEPFFVLRSDPNNPQPADRTLQIDFADQIRLVGLDTVPEVIELPPTGEADLTVVLYWRALQEPAANYSIFLHLDAPDGQTVATVDEVNPENIPTRNWPPGLYLRNPLHLKIPHNLPPIRYDLTTGIYNRASGQRLPTQPGGSTTFRIGPVWLASAAPEPSSDEPLARFGHDITLHRATLAGKHLTLVWQTRRPIDQNLTIFVHALDRAENLLSQADGVPYEGLYPPAHWRADQPITDARLLDLNGQVVKITLGFYNPDTGLRLPVFDAAGIALPDNSFVIPVRP